MSLIVNILAYSIMSSYASFHANSYPLTLLNQFFPKVFFDSHFSLSDLWLHLYLPHSLLSLVPTELESHPYLPHSLLSLVPTELEWQLLLWSIPQQSAFGKWSTLHYDSWGKHKFCLFLVLIPYKPWQCGLNILWLAWQLHSCILNALSHLQCPLLQWSWMVELLLPS